MLFPPTLGYLYPALDWTKTLEELEKEKLERWREMWKEAQEEKQ